MPHGRYGHGSALGPDGRIYVMGGFVWYEHGGKHSHLVYNPQKDVWQYLEPVLGASFGPPSYVGTNGVIVYYHEFIVYNPEYDFWDEVVSLPERPGWYKIKHPDARKGQVLKIPPEKLRNNSTFRQGDGVAVVMGKDGMIYWIGGSGRRNGRGEKLVLPYDPLNARWPEVGYKPIDYGGGASSYETVFKTDMPPMHERRIDHEAVVTSDGRIYVMGGRRLELRPAGYRDEYRETGKIEVTDSVECYDPETNKWEYKKPMTIKRFSFAAVVGPDYRIYTFGGRGEFPPNGSREIFGDTEVYDPGTDTWSALTPMPEPRAGHAGVLGIDGKIYIIGGNTGYRKPPAKDVFIYDPVKDKWEKGPDLKRHRSSVTAIATPDGKIYAIGGTDVGVFNNRHTVNFFLPKKLELYTGKVQDTVEVLDISKKRWKFWD
jgi:hypothetical protein